MVLFIIDGVMLIVVWNMVYAPFDAVFDTTAHVVSPVLFRSGTES
jgi:hypothetical protein